MGNTKKQRKTYRTGGNTKIKSLQKREQYKKQRKTSRKGGNTKKKFTEKGAILKTKKNFKK